MNLPTELKKLNITEEDLLSVALSAANPEQIELLDLAMARYPDVTELALKEARKEYERLIPDLDEALNKAARKREVMTELTEWIVSPAPMQPASGQSIVGRMKDFALKHFTLQASRQPDYAAGGLGLILTEPEPGATEGIAGCGLILPEGFEGWKIEAILGDVYLALELRLPEPTDKTFDIWVTTGVESQPMSGVTADPDEPNLIILDHVKYDKERKKTSIPTEGSFEINTLEDLEARFAELNLLALILVVPAEE